MDLFSRLRFGQTIFLSLFILATSGCTTYHGVASIKSSPEGVQVFDMGDGSAIGVTPVEYHWRSSKTRRKYMNLRLHKEGYQDAVKSFWLNLDHASTGDAFSQPQHLQFDLIKNAE